MIQADALKPLLKYPGGKTSELDVIAKYIPQQINNYIEPFVGGGAVYFFLNNNYNYINDKSEELMLLYEYVKSGNKTFFEELDIIISNWDRLTEVASDDNITNLYLLYREDENINMLPQLSQIVNAQIDEAPMFNLRQSIKFEQFLVSCLTAKFKLIRKNEIKKNEQLDNIKLKENLEAGIKASHHNQNAKYLSYYFHTCMFFEQKKKLAHGTKVIEVTPDSLNNVIIPLPLIEEQERIVEILDRFDKLCNDISEGLPAEIEARQKQYEYYRDKLLKFKG